MLAGRQLFRVASRPVRAFSSMVESAEVAQPQSKRPWKIVKVGPNRPCVLEQRARNAELEAKAKAENLPWRMASSIILHRFPVITKDAAQWEIDFRRVQEKITAFQREAFVERVKGTDYQLIPELNPTHQQIIESMPFTPASRVTEADRTNDQKSLDRKLQESLFLIVKRNRDDFSWQFPQGKMLEGETVRSSAERVLERAVGKLRVWTPGNHPDGYYMYEYPEHLKQQRKAFGAKVFFKRTQLISGKLKFETRLYKDFRWITRDEVYQYFDPATARHLDFMLPY